jgi:hypothetical protein
VSPSRSTVFFLSIRDCCQTERRADSKDADISREYQTAFSLEALTFRLVLSALAIRKQADVQYFSSDEGCEVDCLAVGAATGLDSRHYWSVSRMDGMTCSRCDSWPAETRRPTDAAIAKPKEDVISD